MTSKHDKAVQGMRDFLDGRWEGFPEPWRKNQVLTFDERFKELTEISVYPE